MRAISLKMLVLIFSFLILTGSSKGAIINGDAHVTEEMHEVISEYIVKKYTSVYLDTEKQFEVHKIYGTREVGGITHVYMWSLYEGFNKATGSEGQAGHSLPALIKLKKQGNKYSVTDYKEPEDGTYYYSSLKKLFPSAYVRLASNDVMHSANLQEKIKQKAETWLHE
ncbi:hypothetical protein AM500_19730 [Bacillus sp. FJAT-18017]|uniref:hypothetical protein n=1 Tax=Bacillus sp. FJAT-18017 TaxID=1705566 RepID=UPI0006AF3F12|nr:hypothetical protein [Bacillus sp. FJAT-18017]ALC91762.1 hypothetical protein AM500_19730 [Bacillus sp. FJAT-18017]